MNFFKTTTLFVCWSLTVGVSAQSSHIRFDENPAFDKVLKAAQSENKIIFLDAFTVWCGPCKKMEKEVFTRPIEASFFNENFINVKYDMEKGEGVALKNRFGVAAFPTYLFINAEGEAIHRIVGAHTEGSDFLRHSQRALTNNNFLTGLEKRYQGGERNAPFIWDYLETLRMAGFEEQAQKLGEDYLLLMGKDHFLEATYWPFIETFLKDPTSKQFKILLDNRAEIGKTMGEQKVQNKIFQVIQNQISLSRGNKSAAFDEQAEESLIQFLRNGGFPRSEEMLAEALAARYKRLGDWDRYASVVDAMIEFRFLKDNENPLPILDAHAATFVANVADKPLLKRALFWASYNCELEKRPKEFAKFMRTKSNLLALLGFGAEAAEIKAKAKDLELGY